MPLVRLEVRNVYGLGQTELHTKVDLEDPKAILDGVSVSGLVGILRQLGDLSEFATEIFHGIQEEFMITASRSNKLKMRLKHIEATVPSLHQKVIAQTSHLHFAYTGGLEWHPRIPNGQNQFIYDDLPQFIMAHYEECRDPPRLQLLDKYDINGPRSCLKRYSDPTYFKRASSNPFEPRTNFQKDNKSCEVKKKKSVRRSRDITSLASMANQNNRKTFTSLSFSGRTSSSKTASTITDMQDNRSCSFDSRSGVSVDKTGEKPQGLLTSSRFTSGTRTIASVLSESESENADDTSQQRSPSQDPSCVSWQEKAEILELEALQCTVDGDEVTYGSETDRVSEPVIEEVREIKPGLEIEGESKEEEMESEVETESEGDFFVDALNSIDSESESDQGFQISKEMQKISDVTEQETEKISNKVEDCCRTVNDIMVNKVRNDEVTSPVSDKSDELIHQEPRGATDINSSQCNGEYDITFPSVLALGDSLSGFSNPLYDSDIQEHQESQPETSCDIEASKLWTNGRLLGLKPSKPPISAAPFSLECNTENKSTETGLHRQALDNSSLASPGTDNLVNSDRAWRESHEASSEVCDLSHKLPINGFHSKGSASDDRKATPESIPENDTETLQEPYQYDSPFDWFTSSPPLDHMKISFNSSDTLPTSELKLKFPDKVQLPESSKHTFSSFQLVPETTATSLPDSDSDKDTFCRSSSYCSDNEYLSDNQWEESSGIHERKEQELSDSFLQVEATHKQMKKPKTKTETRTDCLALNLSYLQHPADPLPPPLPPLQWMVPKTSSVNQQSLEDITLSKISKEEANIVTSTAPKPEENNVYKKNNVNHKNVKETEAGDFLHQIRTKQFNLRRVVVTKKTEETMKNKFNVILEKANSIREAVASDMRDDESDTWSDN